MILLAKFALAALLVAIAQAIDPNTSPLVALVMAALLMPGATSAVTSVIRMASDTINMDPRGVVYIVSAALTAVMLLTGEISLPLVPPGSEPVAAVSVWLTWTVTNGKTAEVWYVLLLEKIPVLGRSKPIQANDPPLV